MNERATTRVEFRADWFGYRSGNVAELSSDLAEVLIADGTARVCPAMVDIPNKSMKARDVERK